MTKIYILKGKTNWCKVRTPDEKYDNYQVPLYMDDASWADFEESGIQLKVKEDEDGKYVTFKRRHAEFNSKKGVNQVNGPPEVFILKDDEYVPMPEGLIGNGSEVTVKVQAFNTRNGIGHRLVSVGVDKLVEYNPDGPPESNVPVMPF